MSRLTDGITAESPYTTYTEIGDYCISIGNTANADTFVLWDAPIVLEKQVTFNRVTVYCR